MEQGEIYYTAFYFKGFEAIKSCSISIWLLGSNNKKEVVPPLLVAES